MTVLIPALPTPVPQSTDPVNFAARADAFLAALPGFATAANQQADENNQLNASTVAAAASAKEASDLALASTLASRFDPNATYPAGVVVWSPIDGKTYRRKVAGKAAADPSADAVNWMRQVLTKADFGLGNVDNTSDLNKPISTAVQAALNLKETPAGALAQMRGFGLGNTAGVLIPSLETHRVSGSFLADATVSVAGGLPLTLQHVITYRPGTSTANGEMWATPLTSAAADTGRVWFRKLNSNVWHPWKEVAFLDSPAFTGIPSAPNLKFTNTASSDVNTLDYYEEGSFTPTITGTTTAGAPTYTVNLGDYTRIGNRVDFNMRIAVSNFGGAVGDLRILGLPFLVKSGAANQAGVCVSYAAPFPVNKSPAALFATGTSLIQLFARDNTTTSIALLQASELTSINFHIFGSYVAL